MNKWIREFRLVPIALIAAGSLFALKAIGLVFDGGYTLAQHLSRGETMVVTTTVPLSANTQIRSETSPLSLAAAEPKGSRSWMQEMFGYPDVTGSVPASRFGSKDPSIVTGSVAAPAPAAKAEAPGKAKPAVGKPESKPAVEGEVRIDQSRSVSPGERAILERLHTRRQELDARARELELRETLLKASEKKLEARMTEIKAAEARLTSGLHKKEEAEHARFKSLITMYETMKPKDAAKIFDRLEMKVLFEVASQVNPRRMSEIMAVMTPEAAEKLTVELTTRASSGDRGSHSDLPKIEGKPTGG